MKIVVFWALGIFVGLLLTLALAARIRYRVGSRHVKVLLFGICIRRVALANIESLSKRRTDGWSENWWNTTRPKHRMLVIRRKRGLCRNFVITPKNRYIFRSDIERAMRRAGIAVTNSHTEIRDAEPDTEDDAASSSGTVSHPMGEG